MSACDERAYVAVVMVQLLHGPLPTPDHVLLVVDDIIREWGEYKGALEREGLLERLDTQPGEVPALHRFAESYADRVDEVEGGWVDWDDEWAKIWFAHARKLAPADHPIHQQADGGWCVDDGV